MNKKIILQPTVLKGLVLLFVILSSLYYVTMVKPGQIRVETKTICDSNLSQYKEEAKSSKIEREKHQTELAKLSVSEQQLPANKYLIEKWSDKNVDYYEKLEWEGRYKDCIDKQGKP